jgi:hypothetical protein
MDKRLRKKDCFKKYTLFFLVAFNEIKCIIKDAHYINLKERGLVRNISLSSCYQIDGRISLFETKNTDYSIFIIDDVKNYASTQQQSTDPRISSLQSVVLIIENIQFATELI